MIKVYQFAHGFTIPMHADEGDQMIFLTDCGHKIMIHCHMGAFPLINTEQYFQLKGLREPIALEPTADIVVLHYIR